jgi:hypothetical protein
VLKSLIQLDCFLSSFLFQGDTRVSPLKIESKLEIFIHTTRQYLHQYYSTVSFVHSRLGTDIGVLLMYNVIAFPAGKQKCPFFKYEKWASRGLCMDFATTTMVAKVTVRAPPNKVHVGRSSQ